MVLDATPILRVDGDGSRDARFYELQQPSRVRNWRRERLIAQQHDSDGLRQPRSDRVDLAGCPETDVDDGCLEIAWRASVERQQVERICCRMAGNTEQASFSGVPFPGIEVVLLDGNLLKSHVLKLIPDVVDRLPFRLG